MEAGGEALDTRENNPAASSLQLACHSCPVTSERETQAEPRDADVVHSSSFVPELEKLQSENEKLKRKAKYMDNLGILVTDFKQENQILNEENLRLRKRLEALELTGSREESLEKKARGSVDTDVMENGWEEDPVFATEAASGGANLFDEPDSPFEVVLGNSLDPVRHVSRDLEEMKPDLVTSVTGGGDVTQGMTNEADVTPTTSRAPDVTPTTSHTPDVGPTTSQAHETQDNGGLMLDGDLTKPETEQAGSDVTKQDDKDASIGLSDQMEDFPLPLQIRQLEEMVGLRSPDAGNDVSFSEPSMTSQFSKLAAVFARLAQRVIQSQKKARNSQAFCDALMKENEKMKQHMSEIREQNEVLRREIEELRRAAECPAQSEANERAGASSSPPSGSQDVISRLQARVKKLEGQRTEILRVNRQWDTQYRRLKQEFDARAIHQEQDEGSRNQVKFTNDVPSTSAASGVKQRYDEKRRRDIDVMLVSAKKEIRNLMQEKAAIARNFANAHSQCQTLKRDLAQVKEVKRKLETDKSCLEAENQRLNLALEAAYSIHQRSSIPSDPMLLSTGDSRRRHELLEGARYNILSSSPDERSPGPSGGERSPPPPPNGREMDDLRTQIEVLQEQVKIYREDFETERRDREKSQGEKQRLDEQLTRAKHEVQALTQQVRTHEYDFKQERRDKERLKRQLQTYQRGDQGTSSSSRNRDRYHGDANLFVATRTPHDPPAYYAHRFTGSDETANPYQRGSGTSRRRNRQGSQFQEPRQTRHDWNDNLDIERLLSYPPDDAPEQQPNAL